MIGDWFVGFRPMIKRPPGATTWEATIERTLFASVATVFTAVTSRAGIDAIVDQTVRFDARQGGKLRFISSGDDGYGGTYSRITVGKRVILVTERHGELDFSLSEVGEDTKLVLKASKLGVDDGAAQWRESIDALVDQLIRHTEGAL